VGVVVGAEPGLGLARERKNLILSFTPPLSIRWALEYLLDYNTFTNVVAVCPVTYYCTAGDQEINYSNLK
jgi:hypothetical protein